MRSCWTEWGDAVWLRDLKSRTIALSLLIAVASPGIADAQSTARAEVRRYPWKYHRSDVLDYGVTAAAAAGFVYVHFGVDSPAEAKWTSTSAMDDRFRDWLKADTYEGRRRADVISDVLWYAPMALPWLDLTFPLLGDDWNADTAWQMTLINMQAFSVSAFISRAGHRYAGRARPDVAECAKDPEYNGDHCFAGSYASFPSGHTSTAAVGAGLVCAHHMRLGLLGSDLADGLVCGTAASMALGAGIARIAAERHYVSDVVAGAVIGFGSGLALPMLRHYRQEDPEQSAVRWSVVPTTTGSDGLGLAMFGWF